MDAWLSISGIVVIVVMILLGFVLWKVAKILLIPIQILLFLILMFIAYRLLCISGWIGETSDNAASVKTGQLFCSDTGKRSRTTPEGGALRRPAESFRLL